MSRPSHDSHAKKLGQLLVEHGLITGEQLIRAIQSQRSVGGRIGTCLLEMDVLTEDRLLDALSEQLEVPAARVDQLRGIDDEVLHTVPAKMALRCQAVPFSASDSEIKVATLNVRNLNLLDELAFCTDKKIRPHIANEVRIFEALEKYYGYECPRRYGHLLDRLNRSRYMWDESAKLLLGGEDEMVWKDPHEAFESGIAERKVIRAASGSSSHQAGAAPSHARTTTVRTTTVQTTNAQPEPARPGLAARPRSQPPNGNGAKPAAAVTPTLTPTVRSRPPMTVAELERLFTVEQDREQIAAGLLRFLSQSLSRVALFKVVKSRVQGWLHQGAGIEPQLFQAFDVGLEQPSVFMNLSRGAELYFGPLLPMPAHRQLARTWGGEMPQECLFLPLRIQDRLVAVVYGDRGAVSLSNLDLETFKSVTQKAAAALELCILRRKSEQAFSRQPAIH